MARPQITFKRVLIVLGLIGISLPFLFMMRPQQKVVDLDSYGTQLVVRNTQMWQAATSARDKDKYKIAGELLIALQRRYDGQIVGYDTDLSLLSGFDAKTSGGTMSDENYASFLKEAKPAFATTCNHC